MPIPTKETAARIMALLNESGDTAVRQPRESRGRLHGWRPFIVRCDSSTAAYVSGVGAQCYPATILDLRASDTEQADLGAVWLTVLGIDGDPIVPAEGGLYIVLMSGEFTQSADRRQRVFAVDPDGYRWIKITAEAAADPGPYTGVVVRLNSSGAWEDVSPEVEITSLYRAPSNLDPPLIPVDQVVQAWPSKTKPGAWECPAHGGLQQETIQLIQTWAVNVASGGGCTLDPATFVNAVIQARDLTVTVSDPIDVSDTLTADFSGQPFSVGSHKWVFTDLSTGTPDGWSWTFGDGGTSTSQNPLHPYTASGTYTVALTITRSSDSGTDTETKVGYVVIP